MFLTVEDRQELWGIKEMEIITKKVNILGKVNEKKLLAYRILILKHRGYDK